MLSPIMGFLRRGVRPGFDHRHMITSVGLNQYVEPPVTAVLATFGCQRIEELDRYVGIVRCHVHVGYGENTVGPNLCACGRCEVAMLTGIDRAIQ